MERDTNDFSNDAPINPIEQWLGLGVALSISIILVLILI
jgi:hypothetical protein